MAEIAKTMTIDPKYLDLIAAGTKTVEVRVAYPSNRKLRPGQGLRFVAGKASLDTRIVEVHEYTSFEEMLDHESQVAISGEPESREDLLAAVREIYSPEKEALGVLAIHIDAATPKPPDAAPHG